MGCTKGAQLCLAGNNNMGACLHYKLDVITTPLCQLAIIIDSEGNAVTFHQIKRD